MSFKPAALARRAVVLLALAFPLIAAASPAAAATPAEALVSDNIHKGLEILNNSQLTQAQRGAQFETFLLGITDMKRIAAFTLGQYGAGASQADRDAFAAAFQRYAVAVYQSYLGKYAGQTLKVTGSKQYAPGDDVVTTTLVDPNEGGRPLEVDFRVRSDTGTPVIVDFNVAGVWLALEERDQFVAFLGQNGGSIASLIAHLDELRAKLGAAN
ncbi:MAG TPA: ABC transporter substrate-binding protein [Rhizomicrobium sp.]|nr:ABC transporter substrate-binding protein [Rhizomicrobium sp.]